MQPLRPAVAPGVAVALVTRPSPGRQIIERPKLSRRLDDLVGAHRVTVLVAPAGYGKTTLLSTWAATTDHKVAWLSLTEADRHAEHLARGLQAVLLSLDQRPGAAGGDRVLVVDDVHLAGEAIAALLPLVEDTPPGLRIVLSGRGAPPLGLSRLTASGDLGRLSAEDLSFTADEVDLVGRAVGHPISADRASRLRATTGGWPVAVRLALITTLDRVGALRPPVDGFSIPELPEYLIENVLDSLPPDLRAVVLPACTCDWLTGELAGELAGVSNGAEYLELAIAAGLPLERRGMFRGDPVYRWHPVMAQAGREILLRRDPERSRALDLVAARAIGTRDAFAAAAHALRGRDPALAAHLIRSHWLAAVLRGDSDQLAELCGQLPSPWSNDPEILAVLAACRRNAGDAPGALDLDRRAAAGAAALDAERQRSFEFTLLLARLFVLDDAEALGDVSRRSLEHLSSPESIDPVLHACALLLIGWTELRLRHIRAALPILAEASQRCRAEGLDDLAGRARANYGFTLAFAGDFAGAADVIAEPEPTGVGEAAWRRADGAIEWFSLGWMNYWRGETATAIDAFQRAVDQGGGLISYAQLARCWLLDAAVESGDRALIARTEAVLADIPDRTIQGLPWAVYRGVARAGLLAGRGRFDEAMGILDDVISSEPVVPAANAQAAALYWRGGRVDSARQQADLLQGDLPGYLRIGGLVVRALCDRRDGRVASAHQLLEEALALGTKQALLRPFMQADPELSALLAEHADLGTDHEHFLAQAITRQRASIASNQVVPLSTRESEVLGLLQTRLAAADIAAQLHISPNTLKTHLKAIYRKLGVENRRDAVRVARGDGATRTPEESGSGS